MKLILMGLVELGRSLSKALATLRWLALAMVLLTISVVCLRYLFSTSAILIQESVVYLHAILFMLAIPLGLAERTHVRVDILYGRLPARTQHWIDLAGHALLLIPVAVFMGWISLDYVAASWRIFEGSAEVGGIQGVFLLKTLIPATALLLLLQGLAGMAECILTLTGDEEA